LSLLIAVCVSTCCSAGILSNLNATTTWTILAPTNEAFDKALAGKGLNSTAVLSVNNRAMLAAVLAFHINPSAAYFAANLTDGMNLLNALFASGNVNFTVGIMNGNITFSDAEGRKASVITSDIKANQSVVHIIDNVLMPPESSESDQYDWQSAVDNGYGVDILNISPFPSREQLLEYHPAGN
jgi:uncharacterized surface protein with fasciclin (FAS1) repeats